MSEVLVRADGLSRRFGHGPGSVVAPAQATFEIRQGDHIALVGPSGCGKTTLLHLIAALDQPSEGAIEWPGLGGAADLRPGPVAMAFQGPSLLPPLTVAENVALPALLAGAPDGSAAAAAQALIERLGLSDVAWKLPEEISGGQAQRAGVARALMGEPRLILADEPTGQLDRASAGELMDVLLQQAEAVGAALMIATHDATVAQRLPLRWTMTDRILQTGAPSWF
ncbi:MAG: ABC transporter ATP-binding protein [Actinobacteria bacterium]|nr:ABC transporter ATP-binding protein [Actinomycetota bacterium]